MTATLTVAVVEGKITLTASNSEAIVTWELDPKAARDLSNRLHRYALFAEKETYEGAT